MRPNSQSQFLHFCLSLIIGLGVGLSLPVRASDSRLTLRFFTLEKLATDSKIQAQHYRALQSRFSNDDFDEVLFVGQNSEGERLSREHHRLMLEAIYKFAKDANYADPEGYFSQRPQYPVMNLAPGQDGLLHAEALEMPQTQVGQWLSNMRGAFWSGEALIRMSESTRDQFIRLVAKRNPKVKSIFDLKPAHLAQDPDLLATCLKAYMDLARKDKSSELLLSASILVVAKWLQENELLYSKFNFNNLTDLDSQFLKIRLQAELVPILKNNQLPSRLANNFFKESGLNESAASPFPKNQVVVIPMSKWEAMFKGIGPGECIRASANRFFDAFYPFSQAFALLKDGKEMGYIGVYKVAQRMSDRHIWYIDTVQSPGLVDDSGDTKILDAIMDQLERWALKEGALLAIPAKDWNGTNYKENIPRLHTRGSIAQVEVAFPGSDLLSEIFEFVAKKDQAHHQKLMSNSNYTNDKQMYDTLLRNQYQVRILEPSARLTDSERAQYYRVFGRGLEASVKGRQIFKDFEDLSRFGANLPTNRLRMLQLFQENRLLFMNSDAAKALAEKTLFPDIVKATGSIPTSEDLPAIIDRLRNGTFPSTFKKDLLIQLLPFARQEEHAVFLLNRYANYVGDAEFLLGFVFPLLDKIHFTKWAEVYPALLKPMPDAFFDYAMAAEVVQRIQSPEDFVKFVHITEGKADGVVAGYSDSLNRLLVNHFARILRKIEDSSLRFKFLKDTKALTRGEHDRALVTAYLLNARSFGEYSAVISYLKDGNSYQNLVGNQVMLKILTQNPGKNSADEIIYMLKALDAKTRSEFIKRADLIQEFIAAAGPKYYWDLYDLFLNSSRSDADDKLVNDYFANKAGNRDFETWLAYASGERSKSIFASLEKRQKYFAAQLIPRIASEPDTEVVARMLVSYVTRFGYQSLVEELNQAGASFDRGIKLEVLKNIFLNVISENIQGSLGGTELFEVTKALLRLSNYELDISKIFLARPAIGIKIFQQMQAEGRKIDLSKEALQVGSRASYLFENERSLIREWIQRGMVEVSCKNVFR